MKAKSSVLTIRVPKELKHNLRPDRKSMMILIL